MADWNITERMSAVRGKSRRGRVTNDKRKTGEQRGEGKEKRECGVFLARASLKYVVNLSCRRMNTGIGADRMERKAMAELREWAGRTGRKPMVMRGARQVGKTWLVRRLGEEAFDGVAEINFEKTPGAGELFKSNDPKKIVPMLEAMYGWKVREGRTLLFLDEVQSAPEVLLALRYFYEEMPGLHVVAAGSLLEFALEEHSFSMPVGRIEYFHVGPMTFGEFLRAEGKSGLAEWLEKWEVGEEFPGMLHGQCMEELRKYLVVGGMPESVEAYRAGGGDFVASERVRQGILETFADDFAKYAGRVPTGNIRKVFESVPRQLGEKFTWAKVDREVRSAGLAEAFGMLCKAKVAAKVRRTTGNGVPLGGDADERNFKAVFLDTGLASLACGVRYRDVMGGAELLPGHRGAIAEQFVGQELMAAQETWRPRELFYWARESRTSNAEVDYLGVAGGRVYPIEVKAGATGRLRSMHQFLGEKGTDFGVRFNADVPSLTETDFSDNAGRRKPFRLLSLPLYMAGMAERTAAGCM